MFLSTRRFSTKSEADPDKLRSYAAAKRELQGGAEHRQHKGLNNRAAHQHCRGLE